MLNPLQPFFYLLLYVALIYIRIHEYPDFSTGVPVISITLAVAVVFWLFGVKKNFNAPQIKLLPVFVIVMAFSVAVNGWAGGAVQVVGEFLPILLLFLITATSVNSISRQQQMFLVIVSMTSIIAIDGIVEANTGVGWSGAMPVEDGRITYLGFLSDPNDLATAFIIGVPMALYLAGLTSRYLYLPKLAGIAVASLLLYGVYLTNSRGAFLAVMAMAGLYFSQRYGIVKTLLLLPFVVAPLLMMPSRLDTISTDEESAEGRIESWYAGFDMFFHNPIFGVGKGNFTEHNYLTAHNSFILVFAETGLVGYFLWLSLIILTYVMLIRIKKYATRTDIPDADAAEWLAHRRIADTLFLALTGFLASCLFLSRSYVVLLYLLLALVVAEYQMVRARWPEIVAPLAFRPFFGRIVGYELGSIAFFYLLTRVLLQVG
jgi:O-antigen ligase